MKEVKNITFISSILVLIFSIFVDIRIFTISRDTINENERLKKQIDNQQILIDYLKENK